MATKKDTKKAPKKKAAPKKPAAKKPTKKPTVKKKTTTRKKAESKAKALETIVVPSPVAPDIQMVVASEMADDAMVLDELTGGVMEHFIYTFNDGRSNVTGLSVKGVNEVVRRLNKDKKSGSTIRINPQYRTTEEKEYDGQKGVEVSVFAEDLETGNSAWGIKFEPYKKFKSDGSTYRNDFFLEKALAKAERNAKRKLIPEVAATRIIQIIVEEEPNRVKNLEAPAGYVPQPVKPQAPKPSTVEEVQTVIREAIKNSRDIDMILQFDEKTQGDKRFGKKFKEEIRKLAASRIDELTD